ncbi:BREX system P-loop protein BrxC [Flagellimonas alvinocaridis]|uniref:BREX system P-loop protein BrxC n=1 Tax=Flagellimonas alvinocaridis TaxID=2530200 RepID=A0A4S8RRG7_9FLAO|nr:BREX system P-loop protein BrxC [Allomuricauda alvinocaridis]THV60830.1 BREX system P-loop protein BrxC [Allomuricauda alvinocaridis]
MIKNFFEKNINRDIETVIKADDRDNISTEVTEYVITEEIAKKARDFFDAYNDFSGANGVWISGFFGSGKSHLLKILSYVLENKECDGWKSGELFAEKVDHDEMLKGDILNATRIPSESVLFNIDQQAQITSKEDANAILSVFYKVFYDHLGYYGFQPHVSEFEMWLEKQGIYAQFIELFDATNKLPWQKARIDYFDPAVTDDIAKVLGEINNASPSKYESILDDIENKQKQSIEDFCNRVNDYILLKPKGFRLNFFVDEVGQYISDNTKLMLNLQTIAETLATKTKGNSWILVTSQEDMETVVGDMNKSQQNDFSRIQARFKIKIPLTSANVDEVIEKRLLDKKDAAQKELVSAYKKNGTHLKSLLSFSEAGVQFKAFDGDDDFANKYPFVPYQFDLFQQCRIALSKHNAFQGKHASVGERSMLGVFQQVIKAIEDRDNNALVSFDLMFEGIRNELRGDIQQSLILAERNLTNPFEIKVLKTLFLVKYFNNFKTTKRNISVLLIDDIHVDLKSHEAKIDEALRVLEDQSYIQRSGTIYEFLTDDEKDIEEEIKHTDIDDQAITHLLKEILFDEIIGDSRIKYLENKQDYEFTSKLDGTFFGREKELEIEIITDNYQDYDNESFIQSQTMGSTGMKLVLAPNATFMRDVRMHIKTAKYEKQHRGSATRPQIARILQEKSMLNVTRKRNLIVMADKALGEAKVYLNGSNLEMPNSSDGKTKVVNAFQKLVAVVYPNLRMLKSAAFSEDSIKSMVHSTPDALFAEDDATISEAESEVLNEILRRKKRSDRTTLNDLRAVFTKKPYGWHPNAIWTVTAKLFKRGKIEAKQDSNLLENNAFLNALLVSSNHGNTLLVPQTSFDASAIKKLKEIYKDAFDQSCSLREAKDVATTFKQKLTEMSIEVNQLLAQKQGYPFLSNLEPFSEKLSKWSQKDYSYFITSFSEFEDALLDAKEDMLSPIKRFINGEQRKIYDDIKSLLALNTANFDFIQSDELSTLRELMKSDTPYKGNHIKNAKAAKDTLKEKVTVLIKSEKDEFEKTTNELITDIKGREVFKELSASEQADVLGALEYRKTSIAQERYIANIRQAKQELSEMHTNALNRMGNLIAEKENKGQVNEPAAKYIKRSSIHIEFDKNELVTEDDVNAYVEAVRTAMLNRIHQNLKINLK